MRKWVVQKLAFGVVHALPLDKRVRTVLHVALRLQVFGIMTCCLNVLDGNFFLKTWMFRIYSLFEFLMQQMSQTVFSTLTIHRYVPPLSLSSLSLLSYIESNIPRYGSWDRLSVWAAMPSTST